jgi:hypothetical protein
MKKPAFLKIVNLILGVDFLLLAGSGLLHLQIPYEVYSKAHPILGITLVICVVFHVILNWTWIKNALGIKKNSAPVK